MSNPWILVSDGNTVKERCTEALFFFDGHPKRKAYFRWNSRAVEGKVTNKGSNRWASVFASLKLYIWCTTLPWCIRWLCGCFLRWRYSCHHSGKICRKGWTPAYGPWCAVRLRVRSSKKVKLSEMLRKKRKAPHEVCEAKRLLLCVMP